MGVRHDYLVYLDNDGYFTGFEARDGESGTINFDGSALELDFLNAYKVVDNQPYLDEQRKAEIIIEREEEQRRQERESHRLEAQATYTALVTDTLLPEDE